MSNAQATITINSTTDHADAEASVDAATAPMPQAQLPRPLHPAHGHHAHSEQGRVDARESRAWEKYNAAWQAHADAVAAVQAVSDALGCSIELFERMEAWMARPHCLTPFPWPGVHIVCRLFASAHQTICYQQKISASSKNVQNLRAVDPLMFSANCLRQLKMFRHIMPQACFK
jgi:hypothetical protein